MERIKWTLFFALLLSACHMVEAQTCCSAGAPISSSLDINNSENKSLAIRLDYEYNSVNRLIDNNERLQNDPRRRNGHSITLRTDFALNKKWAFSAFLPLVFQNRTTFSEDESASGPGDLTLLGQYTSYLKNSQLRWSGGIKLPTGEQFITDSRGINLSPDMQSGSGTVDFIGRVAYLKEHVFIQNLTNQTALSYKYNTTNDHFGDPDGLAGRRFKFGNETQLVSAFSYLFVAKKWFLLPELGLLLRHAAPNEEQSIEAPNSGGFWIRVPIGLQAKPNDILTIRLYGEIPVQEYLDGLQITTDYKLGIQIRYQILGR